MKKPKAPARRNPHAAVLVHANHRPKTVPPRKGKGAVVRRPERTMVRVLEEA